MFGMMTIKSLGFIELGLAGFLMGAASGFFWTNRYLLALYNTNDNSRNYFFGLESFFFSITSIGVPLIIGAFISQIDGKEVFGFLFNINTSYCVVTMAAVVITVIACMTLWKGKFENPKETNFLYFRFNILWEKDAVASRIERNGSRFFSNGTGYIGIEAGRRRRSVRIDSGELAEH